MLPIDLNSINLKSKELSETEKLALNIKKPNLALCKQLIYSCTRNIDSSDSQTLPGPSIFLYRPSSSGSQDISLDAHLNALMSSSKKKSVSFGKNDVKILESYPGDSSTKSEKSRKHSNSIKVNNQKCPVPILKGNVKNGSAKIREKKGTKYSLKISLAKKTSSKKLKNHKVASSKKLKKHKVASSKKLKNHKVGSKRLINGIVNNIQSKQLPTKAASQGDINGIVKKNRKKHLCTKKYKKHIEKLTLKLKNDFYGEKVLTILSKIRSSKLSPVIDKKLGITLCLLSLIVYKKFSADKFQKLLKNTIKQESSVFQDRINSIKKGLEHLSPAKFQEGKKKYLRVSLKRLPDCILNHFKNQSLSFSELPSYVCNSCKTADAGVVIPKLPDKILKNYQKGKPIMISNLPPSILNSSLHPIVIDS